MTDYTGFDYASKEPPKEQMIPASVASKMVEQAVIAERKSIGATILKMIDEAPVGSRLGQIENWAKYYLIRE